MAHDLYMALNLAIRLQKLTFVICYGFSGGTTHQGLVLASIFSLQPCSKHLLRRSKCVFLHPVDTSNPRLPDVAGEEDSLIPFAST